MLRVGRYIAVLLALTVVQVATAQERRLVSRSELDSIVNPRPSQLAAGAIVAEPTTKNIGSISDMEEAVVYFTLRNTTNSAIEITELRSSCGCIEVSTPTTHIAPRDSIRLRAKFNAAGRSGSFSLPIHLYTTLDSHRPTLRLTLEGSVIRSDRWSHLPISMGSLRLSRREVTLDHLTVGATRSEIIVVANTGNEAVMPTATTTIEGLELRTSPERLDPGEEGEIVISYTPEQLPPFDIDTIVILEGGIDTRPTERMIKIKIRR